MTTKPRPQGSLPLFSSYAGAQPQVRNKVQMSLDNEEQSVEGRGQPTASTNHCTHTSKTILKYVTQPNWAWTDPK